MSYVVESEAYSLFSRNASLTLCPIRFCTASGEIFGLNAKSGQPGPLFAHSYRFGTAVVSALPVMIGQFPEHTAVEHHAQLMGGFVAIASLRDIEPEITVVV